MGKYKIAELRIKNNISQAQLAERCEVTQRTISRWEAIQKDDKATISNEDLTKLCIALKCDLKDIIANKKDFIDNAIQTAKNAKEKLDDKTRQSFKQKLLDAVKSNDKEKLCEELLLLMTISETGDYNWFIVLLENGLEESKDFVYAFIATL